MDEDRWPRIQELYHTALEKEPGEREAFLAEACADDEKLRREVASLLAHEGRGDRLLEGPAWEGLPSASPGVAPGSTIGAYRVVEQIGAGGMGEVYRAHDTRLGRDVAIKISAARFGDRFQREARAVAALNHPNICTLYDIGPNYLVMELVEGPTLADRIQTGPVGLEESLAIAGQVAAALENAHQSGIVHRDLKPSNIKVRADGTVKVIDFGLAKRPEMEAAAAAGSTVTTMTQAGFIVGTPAYMSPEQARGIAVDKRSDIWSFGVVFYEMLTGRRLFEGENPTEILASIVKEQPDLSAAPVEVRRLLIRCLEKDPKKRLRDMSVVLELLEQQPALAAASTPPRSGTIFAERLAWATAALLLASTAVFAFLWRNTSAPEIFSTQFEINPPGGMQFSNVYGATAVSPDGRYIVFGAVGDQGVAELWLRPLDSLAARRLQGSERANLPFWSPDSKSIGFYEGGKLKRTDIAGGGPVVLCDAAASNGAGGTWNRDGTILFTSGVNVFRVHAAGGIPRQIAGPDKSRKEIATGPPQFLPDGKHFLIQVYSADPSATGIYALSLDRPKERVWIMANNGKGIYLASSGGQPGFLLWIADQTLLAQRFDAGKLKLEGDPAPIVDRVVSWTAAPIRAAFWGSETGVLAYRTSGDTWKSALTWFDRQGRELGTVGKPEAYGEFALSPDGSRIAAYRAGDIGEDLWLIDPARVSISPLTTARVHESYPVWSPDGKQIAFARSSGSGFELYRKPAGVSGTEEQLLNQGEHGQMLDWSRNGRFILFARPQGRNRVDLWVLPMGERERKPVQYLATGFRLRLGSFSPDGRWVMYASNISGREEIYVSPFPDASAAPAVMVSTDGGTYPRWRRDGKAVYYLSPDSKLVEVQVLPGSSFKVSVPKPLFEVHAYMAADPAGWSWDISPDGQRFLFNIPANLGSSSPLTVITNWQSRLKK